MKVTVEREVGGRPYQLTTGEIAKQANGSVLVQFGETVLLVAAQDGPPRPGISFFPLQVDYRERLAAAGKFAGGFLKREGRPSTKEILTARLTDRSIRPLFPKGYFDEVQVMANVLASDGENDPDVLAITGASTALSIASIPFNGPIAGVRVGKINNDLILMPSQSQLTESALDLIVAGNRDSVLMIEGFGTQIPEDEMTDAIMFAHREIRELCGLQRELAGQVPEKPPAFQPPPGNPLFDRLREEAYGRLKEAKATTEKQTRSAATDEVKQSLVEQYFPEDAEETSDGATRADFGEAFHDLERRVVRDLALDGTRVDGRKPDEMRSVSCDVDFLPRVHGSAVFTRGETQSVATVTLGTSRDQQRFEDLFEEGAKRFMLHYYFPPYCVGEVRPIRGPGRREIGHGALAERSVESVLPPEEKFPYTIRVISDITESNGSSSMASVCSATLSLMASGVPIAQPVAGISIGLVKETDEKYLLLTDIMGDEDHFGDMDFKVAGTQKGITGIQLDLKIEGINERIIRETLEQAKAARIELLRTMLSAIRRPRAEVSQYAPRLRQVKIDPEKISLLIGPGGKTIRALQEETGTNIDIAEDGTVTVSGESPKATDEAIARIEAMSEEIKVGRIYTGTVNSIKDFGAFIEIAPGKDGLCHISELADGFVKSVTDVVKLGEKVPVKVINVDEQNRVKLSRKAALAELGQSEGKGEKAKS